MSETTADAASGTGDSPSTGEVPEWLSLDSDEEIRWTGEPSMVSLVGTAVWGVILSIVLVGLLVLVFLPLSWLSLKNTDYVVTNKALYVKQGVLSTNIESVGLDKIQNTEYSQSFWGKQFGFATIDVSTAGSSGAEIQFRNVANAREVRERINTLSSEYSSGSTRSGEDRAGGERRPGVPPAEEGMQELLAELRATRQALERVDRALRENARGASGPADAPTASEREADDPDPDTDQGEDRLDWDEDDFGGSGDDVNDADTAIRGGEGSAGDADAAGGSGGDEESEDRLEWSGDDEG